jgi:hypothetical protein
MKIDAAKFASKETLGWLKFAIYAHFGMVYFVPATADEYEADYGYKAEGRQERRAELEAYWADTAITMAADLELVRAEIVAATDRRLAELH